MTSDLQTIVDQNLVDIYHNGIRELDYQTLVYRVGVDLAPDKDDRTAYVVVNKVTGVLEYITYQLFDAISSMRSMQTALNTLLQTAEAPQRTQ